ncbi:MAG TPA: hypothetical protein VND66_06685 [Acidobacteriaceae bacterium]|nr:hypothetical protein [Terriglobia bacterium]HVC90292.1 hypothetical protein [Acidobacteriaceae bacterium]
MTTQENEKVENRREDQKHAVQPSGYDGKNPATAGPADPAVRSPTPETEKGEINPSAPNDVNRTPDRK